MGQRRGEVTASRAPLPVFLNRFVARDREVAAVAELLEMHRAVTLTAPGGLGKTRLAVRVAEQAAARWRGGIWFADYSGATDPGAVARTLATALGLGHEPGQATVERLVERLSRGRCLLLLDGCEGNQQEIRELATALLHRSPGLHILATSRERLEISGEILFPVLPLPCPPADELQAPERLIDYEAVALFEERALASQPGFAITAANAAVVASLCLQLDGIPLALELAAARLRMMSLLDIEAHLADRFRLLTGGSSERHESVRATIDWSYRFLDEAERSMFRRLAVFPSGFRLDAAAAVLHVDGMELVDAVGRLVDKSLLEARTDGDGRTRYHMLETIRRYALELQEPEERDEAMARSMTHLLALAEEATTRAESSDWPAWLDRLVAEHDNLRVVLNWARERNHHDLPSLVIALGWFWQRRGDPAEGRRWLEAAMALASDDRRQLEILRWATNLAAYENDVAAALRYAERAMVLADRLGDVIQTAHARLALGNLIFYQQAVPDWAHQASQHYEVAERLFDEAGLTFRVIAVQLNRSMLDLARGDVASGRQRAIQAHERAGAGGWVHWEWRARMRFGIADFLDEHDEEAERHFAACVRYGMTSSEFGNRLRVVLQWLAAVAARRGELDRSAQLAGAAGVVGKSDAAGSFLPHELLSALGEWQERVRRELGDAAYEQHLESGASLSRADLRRLVQRDGGDRSDVRPMLSGRELQVVELVAEGLTNREVAERLHLSPRTVDAHLDHVRNKLGLRTRAQVVRWLVESRQLNGGRSGGGEPGELE